MKKVLKIAGLMVGFIALVLAGLATWISTTALPAYEVTPIKVGISQDSHVLAQGQKIVENLCAYCHRAEDGTLSGKRFSPEDSEFGVLYSGNLTHHPELGIGKYSDEELAFLIRTGIKRDGGYIPMMGMALLSDEDLAATVSYLRSDQPSLESREIALNSGNKYSFLAKALLKFGLIKPVPYAGDPIFAPSKSDKPAYGKYLATALYDCYGCHSASFETRDALNPENSPGYFAGGQLIEFYGQTPVTAANLTPHPENGLGRWTFEQFKLAVKSGVRPGGEVLSTAMPRIPLLGDEEVEAIWSYLLTIPASQNKVDR